MLHQYKIVAVATVIEMIKHKDKIKQVIEMTVETAETIAKTIENIASQLKEETNE